MEKRKDIKNYYLVETGTQIQAISQKHSSLLGDS
jgi:hypothetical protein